MSGLVRAVMGTQYVPTRWGSDKAPRDIPRASRWPCTFTAARFGMWLNHFLAGFMWGLILNALWRGHYLFTGPALAFVSIFWCLSTASLGIAHTYTILLRENWKWRWQVFAYTFLDTWLALELIVLVYYFVFSPPTLVQEPLVSTLYHVCTLAMVTIASLMHASITLWAGARFILYIYEGNPKKD